MKRTLLIILFGLGAGVVAHVAWFEARQPGPAATLDTQLAWIRAALSLDSEQYQRIKTLHQELEPRLALLASDLESMQRESAAFEQQRRTEGQVDFLRFAQLVERRRATDREYNESSRHLIAAALSVMTQEQRDRYMQLIAPALHDLPGRASQ